jgi:hypothetical protein
MPKTLGLAPHQPDTTHTLALCLVSKPALKPRLDIECLDDPFCSCAWSHFQRSQIRGEIACLLLEAVIRPVLCRATIPHLLGTVGMSVDIPSRAFSLCLYCGNVLTLVFRSVDCLPMGVARLITDACMWSIPHADVIGGVFT